MQNNDISIPEDKKLWNTMQLSNGKVLRYATLNARLIEIHSDCFIEEDYIEDEEIGRNVIHFLNFSDVYRIKVGDEFNTKILDRELKYTIAQITKLGRRRYVLASHVRNKSSIYIVPMLGGKKEDYLYDWYFINGYIADTEDYFYTLYRFIPGEEYLKFEEAIQKHPLFVNKIDKKEYVLFKFYVPEGHIGDIAKFKAGKYSQLSALLKLKIMEFHKFYKINPFTMTKAPDFGSHVVGALYKHESLRKKKEEELNYTLDISLDLDSKPQLNKEIWISQT